MQLRLIQLQVSLLLFVWGITGDEQTKTFIRWRIDVVESLHKMHDCNDVTVTLYEYSFEAASYPTSLYVVDLVVCLFDRVTDCREIDYPDFLAD